MTITVHIYDMQPPAWVWTREAKIAWATNRPWRMKAQTATVGMDGYLEYRRYLLKQAWDMYGHLHTISDVPTEKIPVIRRKIKLPATAERRGLLTIYSDDTVKVEVVR